MSFWDDLYFGLGAEYLVTGELFMAGYEAFKLPADFGLDLVVTAQKDVSFRSGQAGARPPFVLQVKSRRVRAFAENVMGRLEASASVFLKEDDWDLITRDGNAYLVCALIFTDDPNRLQSRWTYFWLHSSHLSELMERGYVAAVDDARTGRRKYSLKVVLRLQATVALEDVLDDLVADRQLTKEGRRVLLDNFAEAVPTRWSTREYMALVRPSRGRSGGEVVRMIPPALTSFHNLGEEVSIRGLD